MPLSYFLTQHGASISEYPIDPECIHEHVCIQWLTSISLHVVPENIPRKKYPNSNVKLQYQYRIKLEMSSRHFQLNPILILEFDIGVRIIFLMDILKDNV